MGMIWEVNEVRTLGGGADGNIGGIHTLGCATLGAIWDRLAGTGVGVGDVAVEKMVLSCLMAVYRVSLGSWNGALGYEFARASARVLAARAASSAGEDVGQAQLCGKMQQSLVFVHHGFLGCIPCDSGSVVWQDQYTSRRHHEGTMLRVGWAIRRIGFCSRGVRGAFC